MTLINELRENVEIVPCFGLLENTRLLHGCRAFPDENDFLMYTYITACFSEKQKIIFKFVNGRII